MNAPSIDIRDIILANGIPLTFGTNLFIGQEPVNPANCVTIYDTHAGAPELTLDKCTFHYPVVKIRCRHTDYVAGFNLLQSIVDQLHGRAQEPWNGTLYSSISSGSEVSHIGNDDQGNPVFIVYINIQRRPI